ncbi:hypothetical protein [Muricauda sp. MAR_2010_75]|uniref:hypothetical protein n=1 Tax=Allomuricauda sp. MAR_2010_75 TaxID=1250232 RepID=UPI0012E08383|nr:hypothetical protein [Muricauda sp. MAR_2010_75]
MDKINEYEIEGLIGILRETGIKGILKHSDLIVWNHILERGWCEDSSRDGMIRYLRENTDMSYGEITSLLNRFKDWKELLPSYSLKLNSKLDSINKRYNSIVPFQWIGESDNRKLLGFVNEERGINVYDGSGDFLVRVCEIKKGNWEVNWKNTMNLTVPQQRYILDEISRLKKTNWI